MPIAPHSRAFSRATAVALAVAGVTGRDASTPSTVGATEAGGGAAGRGCGTSEAGQSGATTRCVGAGVGWYGGCGSGRFRLLRSGSTFSDSTATPLRSGVTVAGELSEAVEAVLWLIATQSLLDADPLYDGLHDLKTEILVLLVLLSLGKKVAHQRIGGGYKLDFWYHQSSITTVGLKPMAWIAFFLAIIAGALTIGPQITLVLAVLYVTVNLICWGLLKRDLRKRETG